MLDCNHTTLYECLKPAANLIKWGTRSTNGGGRDRLVSDIRMFTSIEHLLP